MRLTALPVLTAVLLAAPATGARAAPVPTPLSSPTPASAGAADTGEPERTVWYGNKLMLADALSLALVFVGAGTGADPLAIAGVGGVFVGAPVIHLVEGQGGRAAGSLGMRLALPLAGGALAVWAYDRGRKGSGECDCMGGMFAYLGGVMLGTATAMVVDAAFLGWRSEASTSRSLSLIPSVGLAPGGGSVGLAGRF